MTDPSPATRASGKRKTVTARFVHNGRLAGALNAQAFASLNASPGARAFYDEATAWGTGKTSPSPPPQLDT